MDLDCWSFQSEKLKVLTYAKLLELEEASIAEAVILIDEFHLYYQQHRASIGKVCKASCVFSLSATLGGHTGKQKLKRSVLEQHNVEIDLLETGDVMRTQGKVDLHTVAPRRNNSRQASSVP